MSYSSIIEDDVKYICAKLGNELLKAEGSTWVISGGAGFIGGYFLDLLNYCNRKIFKVPCRIICIENFISGIPERISHLKRAKNFRMLKRNVVKPLVIAGKVDYIIHAASIASPAYYRKYPIETIEANVIGLKNLLELGRKKKVKSLLYFSTSEIYGDPAPEYIPTAENYGSISFHPYLRIFLQQ